MNRLSLEQELLARRLCTVDTLEDAKMTAAAADEPLCEALLEMRIVTEDQLVDLFHQKLGFPLVDDTYFDKLEPDTLELVPRDLAVKNRVLPLYRSGDKLFVAAIDPLSQGLTEVAFVTQRQLIVCVARASSILRALSLRYRAPTLLRKAPRQKAQVISEPLSKRVPPPPPPPKAKPPTLSFTTESVKAPAVIVPETSPPIQAKPKPMRPIVPIAEPSHTVTAPAPIPILAPPEPAKAPDAARAAASLTAVTSELDPGTPNPRKLDSSLAELFKHTAPSVQSRPASRLPRTDDYERVRLELVNVSDRDAVGRILSLFAARFFPRVVILAHKQGMLFGWHSVGIDVSTSRLKGLIVPLHLPSVFQHIVQNKTYHIGPIEPAMINSAFLAAIGDSAAGHALIVPILVEKRVATVLYADTAGAPQPNADLSMLYRLCDDAGQALSALIRRQRAT